MTGPKHVVLEVEVPVIYTADLDDLREYRDEFDSESDWLLNCIRVGGPVRLRLEVEGEKDSEVVEVWGDVRAAKLVDPAPGLADESLREHGKHRLLAREDERDDPGRRRRMTTEFVWGVDPAVSRLGVAFAPVDGVRSGRCRCGPTARLARASGSAARSPAEDRRTAVGGRVPAGGRLGRAAVGRFRNLQLVYATGVVQAALFETLPARSGRSRVAWKLRTVGRRERHEGAGDGMGRATRGRRRLPGRGRRGRDRLRRPGDAARALVGGRRVTPSLDGVLRGPAAVHLAMPGQMALAAALDLNLARTKRLADGTIGYFTRPPRQDDCFAAALATVLRVPIAEVPDPRIDERLARGWHRRL